MDPRAAFPVMMGAGALVAMAGGIRFMRKGRYTVRAALGLTLGGIPAVLIAGLLVKSLPLWNSTLVTPVGSATLP
jgi:ABC-type uncharacterized transport system permease subunit